MMFRRIVGLGLLLSGPLIMAACDGDATTASREAEYEGFNAERREYYSQVASCMTDLGVPMRLMATGDGIEPVNHQGGDAQADASLAAYSACAVEAGGHPEMPPPPTAEEIGRLYELNLEVLECLDGNGFPSTEPPSREVYVQSYLASYSGGNAPWSPYVEPTQRMLEVCPEPTMGDVHAE